MQEFVKGFLLYIVYNSKILKQMPPGVDRVIIVSPGGTLSRMCTGDMSAPATKTFKY